MSEVDLGGVRYHCLPLPTQMQWYVYRRLMPVFQGFAPLIGMTALVRGEDGTVRPDLSAIPIVAALSSLIESLGRLSDADTDYVKDACLDACRWQQGQQWLPVRAPGGAMIQGAADRFDVQVRLVWEVLRTSFENFSPEIAFPFQLTNSNGLDQTEAPAMMS